ncbi:MAG: hypothetical protein PUP91_16450 [Rhizonema sp. PD37]|nr:hypothetical protein [Rhizonema sp. PD37]
MSSSVLGCTVIALEVVAGADIFSMIRTDIPKRASSSAAVMPVGPAPAISIEDISKFGILTPIEIKDEQKRQVFTTSFSV